MDFHWMFIGSPLDFHDLLCSYWGVCGMPSPCQVFPPDPWELKAPPSFTFEGSLSHPGLGKMRNISQYQLLPWLLGRVVLSTLWLKRLANVKL